MPTKFYYLTKELELLIKKINQAPPLAKIDSKELLKYHSLISKKEYLENQISQLSQIKELIIHTYDTNNEKWLYDDSMNCRQYCKLEQRAAYTRDKKLFKLGFLDIKPKHPFIQNFENSIYEKIIEPYSEPFNSTISNIEIKLKSLYKKSHLTKINNYIKSKITKKQIEKEIKKEANLQSTPFLSQIKVTLPSNHTYIKRTKTHDIQDQYDIAL